MTVNILIGIGGTGAKVAEAIIHATAVGLGPDDLKVGFIDQDRANGNTTRAHSLVTKLIEARRLWRTNGRPHRIDSGELLRPNISFIDATKLWTPHPSQSTTLAQIFGSQPEDKPFFDLMFKADASEQDMPLDGGYRGRPYIGSAAITAAMQDDHDPFWRSLDELLRRARTGEQVQLLLTGSVFGGTGAAGFPTIARLIRRKIEEAGVVDNVRVGGVLMLPYFGFPPADAGAMGRAANVAKSDELLLQSRGALRYYSELLRDEHVFDELYLAGWNKPFMLGYHAPDTAEQKNPALLPELVAAMGGCRFFLQNKPLSDDSSTQIYVSSRTEGGAFDWADLASPDLTDSGAPFSKLGRALRFAIAWKHYRMYLARKPGFFKGIFSRQSWYKKQGLNKVNYSLHAPDEELVAMDEYVNAFIEWAGSIQAFANDSGIKFDLWKLDGAINVDMNKPNNAVNVHPEISDDEVIRKTYAEVVVRQEAKDELPTTANLASDLTNRSAMGSHEGLGQVAASLYEFCAV